MSAKLSRRMHVSLKAGVQQPESRQLCKWHTRDTARMDSDYSGLVLTRLLLILAYAFSHPVLLPGGLVRMWNLQGAKARRKPIAIDTGFGLRCSGNCMKESLKYDRIFLFS